MCELSKTMISGVRGLSEKSISDNGNSFVDVSILKYFVVDDVVGLSFVVKVTILTILLLLLLIQLLSPKANYIYTDGKNKHIHYINIYDSRHVHV